jgi:hypothetical protein
MEDASAPRHFHVVEKHAEVRLVAAQLHLDRGGRQAELATDQGTQVTGLHPGAADTDMMAGFDVEKNDPVDAVRTALDGLAARKLEILVDDASAR